MNITPEMIINPTSCKSYCKKCRWNGLSLYSPNWEWCEKPDLVNSEYTGLVGRIPAIKKIDKNSAGECKDFQEKRAWWKFWIKRD